MRAADMGTTGAYSRAEDVRVWSLVSCFHARNPYSYVQHCFYAVSAKYVTRQFLCHHTQNFVFYLFSILLRICKRRTRHTSTSAHHTRSKFSLCLHAVNYEERYKTVSTPSQAKLVPSQFSRHGARSTVKPLRQVHCSRPTRAAIHPARFSTNRILCVVPGLSRLLGVANSRNGFEASSGGHEFRLGNISRTILLRNGFSLVARGRTCIYVRVSVVAMICPHCTNPGCRV